MRKSNKMPTAKALLVFSWLIGILGLATSGYLTIFRFNGLDSVISGILILFGGLLLAVVIRMLANIGQMVFDIKCQIWNNLEQINCDSKDINQNIHQIKTFFERIEGHLDLKK